MKKQLLSLILLCSIISTSISGALFPGNTPEIQYMNKMYSRNQAYYDARAKKLEKICLDTLELINMPVSAAERKLLPQAIRGAIVMENILCKVITRNADLQSFVNEMSQDKEYDYVAFYKNFFQGLISYDYFKIVIALAKSISPIKGTECSMMIVAAIQQAVRQEIIKELKIIR